jgi:hypothetical protein
MFARVAFTGGSGVPVAIAGLASRRSRLAAIRQVPPFPPTFARVAFTDESGVCGRRTRRCDVDHVTA